MNTSIKLTFQNLYHDMFESSWNLVKKRQYWLHKEHSPHICFGLISLWITLSEWSWTLLWSHVYHKTKRDISMHDNNTKTYFAIWGYIIARRANAHIILICHMLQWFLSHYIPIRAAWSCFGKNKEILQDKQIPISLKKQVMDQCILPTMTYGCQTWSLNKQMTNKLRTAQRAMERKMLDLKLKDKIPCAEIRKRTKIIDIIEYTLKQK